jgi:hypothetical protein
MPLGISDVAAKGQRLVISRFGVRMKVIWLLSGRSVSSFVTTVAVMYSEPFSS